MPSKEDIGKKAERWQELADKYYRDYQMSGDSVMNGRYHKYDEYASIARLAYNAADNSVYLSGIRNVLAGYGARFQPYKRMILDADACRMVINDFLAYLDREGIYRG